MFGMFVDLGEAGWISPASVTAAGSWGASGPTVCPAIRHELSHKPLQIIRLHFFLRDLVLFLDESFVLIRGLFVSVGEILLLLSLANDLSFELFEQCSGPGDW